MNKERTAENEQVMYEEFDVSQLDEMQRFIRDSGIMDTFQLVSRGIDHGSVLEIAPGPGYLGLEWLKATQDTHLTGVEISLEMIDMANRNAGEYGLSHRVDYVQADARRLPFPDHTFDAVFTNGSLHEWDDPLEIFQEIHRVLKPGGHFFIKDLKRDLNWFFRTLMYYFLQPREVRPGFITSVRAAYTAGEIREMLRMTPLEDAPVNSTPFGLYIAGRKPA